MHCILYYNFIELFPLTNYTLSVHGENILGAGLKSENRTVTTPGYYSNIGLYNNNVN